jgi:tetratricopeptide (TPR) repeat protein
MAKGFKAVKRVSKKELKEDQFVVTYFKARKWIEENQTLLLKVGAGVVIVAALAGFWVKSRSHAESQAAYELSMVMVKGQTGGPEVVTQQLSDLAKKYSGTSAGDDALFYVGQLKTMAHKPDEALKAYDDYIKHGSKDRYLYPAALAGKAASLEDLKRFKEAADVYLQAAAAKTDAFGYPGFRLDAARCFELAGEVSKAREQYELVKKNNPKTAFATQAERGLAGLPAKS